MQAARISYGAGTKSVQDDRGLIGTLMRNRPTTPFEMCELKLHVRVSMDCWRQWICHRTVIGYEVVSKWCPIAWKAFLDYRFKGLQLSKNELTVVQHMLAGDTGATTSAAVNAGLLKKVKSGWKKNRERTEMEEKLKQLGLKVPWLETP